MSGKKWKSWSATDTNYMVLAEPLFGGFAKGHGPDGQYVFYFVVDDRPYSAYAAEIFREAVRASQRHSPGVTAWIDVTAPSIPQFVLDGIAANAKVANRMVVTYAGGVSHDPSRPLVPALLEALRTTYVDAPLWHPVLQKEVRAIDT